MGYSGKIELKFEAQRLRTKGLSVKEIQKKLKVSRSSVSLWVRNIKLTHSQLRVLYLNKKTGGLKGSFRAAANKTKKRIKLTEELLKKGKKEIKSISSRDKFIAGIALYFAEGDKTDKSIAFTNSDPRAIKFIINWLRKYCKIPESKFRCSLYIHNNLDENKAKKFWSNLTTINIAQFNKSYIVNNNLSRYRKTKHEYGVLRIYISDVNKLRKIMGWIAGVFPV